MRSKEPFVAVRFSQNVQHDAAPTTSQKSHPHSPPTCSTMRFLNSCKLEFVPETSVLNKRIFSLP